MYHFSYFKAEDKQAVLALLEAYPLAFLTGSDAAGRQVATQIPMIVEEKDGELWLQGHIMRHTDHHRAFNENPQALAVFTGPSAYVSASWYSNPQSGSTWNYMSVHISGKIRYMADEELVALMRKFTLKFENGNTQSQTIYDNLPPDYVNRLMPAIVGIEIKAEKLDNVFKLSQNRDQASYQSIMLHLAAQGGNSALIAAEMKKREAALFHAEADGTT